MINCGQDKARADLHASFHAYYSPHSFKGDYERSLHWCTIGVIKEDSTVGVYTMDHEAVSQSEFPFDIRQVTASI